MDKTESINRQQKAKFVQAWGNRLYEMATCKNRKEDVEAGYEAFQKACASLLTGVVDVPARQDPKTCCYHSKNTDLQCFLQNQKWKLDEGVRRLCTLESEEKEELQSLITSIAGCGYILYVYARNIKGEGQNGLLPYNR